MNLLSDFNFRIFFFNILSIQYVESLDWMTWHYSAYIHTDIDTYEIIHAEGNNSQHSLMNVVNESMCFLWVYCWLCDESSVAHTCAELRAFLLFPSLAPDLPPTMGSWPWRLTPAWTPVLHDKLAANIYECINACFARAYCFLCDVWALPAFHCNPLAFIRHTVFM